MFLEVKDLVKHFPLEKGFLSRFLPKKEVVHAVCHVSLDIREGETFGLVGETGSGKTTLGRCILRLIEPTSGSIMYRGRDLCTTSRAEMKKLRGELQIIFQDPFSSLNPHETVARIIGRPMELHGTSSGLELRDRVIEILRSVGLESVHADRYPHEFSGGQRQRIAIARALSVNPRFIVADEPLSSLDVSVQAQILNLLRDLQEKYMFSCLFISHDLSVIRYLTNRSAVMHLGKIVELAKTRDLFEEPLHPYTQALISSIPVPDPKGKRAIEGLKGEVPSPIYPPSGCRFNPRCRMAESICTQEEPELRQVRADHFVACHLV
jgi:oligopeptide/dipeptide ABC transporter ATP-binding protein